MCGETLPERKARGAIDFTGHKSKSSPADLPGVGLRPPVQKTEEAEARQRETLRAQLRAEEQKLRVAAHDPEPVITSGSVAHEPMGQAVERVAALTGAELREYEQPWRAERREREAEYAASAPMTSATPIEQPATTLSGPSFLGLSGGQAGGSSDFSYLYEDEQPTSHTGLIVFVLVLAVLGGVVYAKWQPIRDYVVNTAIAHSQGKAAPVSTTPTDTSATASNAATTPPATDQANNPNGLPQQDKDAAGNTPKADTGQPAIETTTPDANNADKNKIPDQTSTPKDERPQAEVGRSSRFQDKSGKASNETSNDEETAADEKPESHPTAAKRNPPTPPAGAELVAQGEKYLYGRGAPKSCDNAVKSFQAAAQEKNARAMSQLGSLYATGVCLPYDRAQAYQWFSRALQVDRSNTYLEHNLNMLWRDMSAEEKTRATRGRTF